MYCECVRQMEFVHIENLCGQTLLRLVSRGNSILAELQRLSDHIPEWVAGLAPGPLRV